MLGSGLQRGRGCFCCSSRLPPAAAASRRGVFCSATTEAPAATCYQLNFNNCLDKKHEGKALRNIIKLPPGALQGLSNKSDDMLAGLQIKTVQDLGQWKHFRAARAIAILAATEEPGKRPDGAASNINGILDKEWESKSLADILAAPPSALQGLGPGSDGVLAGLGIKSVADLAAWRFAIMADALTILAEHERADFSSQ